MPIPSYPENRREEYLNNIATGSGEIPPYPENREEQYLDAIARNGGGGGSTGGGVLVVHADADTGALDKTWQEIADADCVVFPYANGAFMFYAQRTAVIPAAFAVMFTAVDPGGNIMQLSFQAASADGYPVAQNA